MKKLIVLSFLLAAVGYVGYRVWDAYKAKETGSAAKGPAGSGGGAPAKGGPGGAAMRLPLVDTARATEGMLEDRVSLVGSLRPIAEVQVMSKIAGRLEKVSFDVGDSVKAGELIAQVEDREILQQMQQAEAANSVARALIRQREAELANLSRQVARYRGLFEENLISGQDLDDVATRQASAEAQLELTKAQLRQSDANLAQLRINLENTKSYAPMTGFVARRFVHPGALVSINTTIVTLVDLATLRMIINMVEKDIVRVTRGTAAEINVDAFPGRTFPGRILRVSPVLDPATRTGEVEIHVSNPALDLRAEMFARVSLNLGGNRRGLLVPREAVVYRGEESGVFVLNGNRAKFRVVQPGITQQNTVEVLEGLSAGETVVSMGATLLKDGDQVRVKGAGGPGERPGGEPRGKPGGAEKGPGRPTKSPDLTRSQS